MFQDRIAGTRVAVPDPAAPPGRYVATTSSTDMLLHGEPVLPGDTVVPLEGVAWALRQGRRTAGSGRFAPHEELLPSSGAR